MTINGGQPHRVGYAGQTYKMTVHDEDLGKRRIIGWSNSPFPADQLRGIETRPGWTDARSELVVNRETGDREPG